MIIDLDQLPAELGGRGVTADTGFGAWQAYDQRVSWTPNAFASYAPIPFPGSFVEASLPARKWEWDYDSGQMRMRLLDGSPPFFGTLYALLTVRSSLTDQTQGFHFDAWLDGSPIAGGDPFVVADTNFQQVLIQKPLGVNPGQVVDLVAARTTTVQLMTILDFSVLIQQDIF